MAKKIYFLSKDANWQLYRNEVLTKLAFEYDYEVEVLTTGTIKEHLKENDRLKYIKFNNWFGPKSKVSFFPGAIMYALKSKPFAILAVNNSTQLTEYLTVLLCKIASKRFVWWTHAYDHNPKRKGIAKSIKDAYVLTFLKLSRSVITFSVAGKNYLIQKGISAEKIFPALNTLDTDKLIALKNNVSAGFNKQAFLSQRFSNSVLEQEPVVLLFSGRLKKDKRVGNAIKALKILTDKNVEAILMVVGDGEDMEDLKSVTQSLNLNDRVHFGGFVFDESTISQYFLASDLFVMPGYVGLAIVHAFTFNLPILTENIPFHSPEIQYLKSGENGFFVEENNPQELADRIAQIKRDPSLLKKLQLGVQTTVDTDANINSMISNMNKAITYEK